MHVGAAVHYLHRCGYLYRDLKPGNVHLREGVPVLLDFDVVREIEPIRRPADRLGTAPYMAPEQVLKEPLSAATDVYGLGAMLYELVTGKWATEEPVEDDDEEWNEWDDDEDEPAVRAWWSSTRRRRADRELTTRELEQRYPQIKNAPFSPRAHVSGLPRELEAVILRALEADPVQALPVGVGNAGRAGAHAQGPAPPVARERARRAPDGHGVAVGTAELRVTGDRLQVTACNSRE